jgi:hypothetical protein
MFPAAIFSLAAFPFADGLSSVNLLSLDLVGA